jgi:transposase-like protein
MEEKPCIYFGVVGGKEGCDSQYWRVPRDRFSIFKPVFLEVIRQHDAQLTELAFKLCVKGLTTLLVI